ncbi:MAG TPA: 3-hydroxyacyl-CoA dehydrogenase NAD-binding domain-containing protein [Candidatus Eisenbacteria bacterium]
METFRIESAPDGIAWLVVDAPGEKVNVLSSAVLGELQSRLETLAASSDVRAIGVISGKPGTFIAGADVDEIGAITSAAAGVEASRRGQAILGMLAMPGKPTLAAIDGACLGGGLELALACHFRIAGNSPATRLGLPEVKLGIIPGFGGTQRLPRVIGFTPALDLAMTGRTIDASRAERLGLVDEAVPPAILRARGEAWLRRALTGERHGGRWARLKPRRKPKLGVRVTGWMPVRPFIVLATDWKLKRTLHGDYPAPHEAMESVEESFHTKLDKGLAHEAGLVGPLLVTPTCKNLTWLFRANNEARRPGAIRNPETGNAVPAREVRNAAVIGAGVMGGGIAHLLAEQGIPVRLKDLDEAALVKGMSAAAGLVAAQRKKGRIDRRAARDRMSRIAPALTWDGFGSIDCVIEAVVEDLGIKQRVVGEIESVVPERCVIATNTSSLPIGGIAAGARHPDRIVGLHFFNPVHRMPLVEVIAGRASSAEAVATAHGLARRLGKTPIVVTDTPGFLVNRVLTAYLAEALRMLVEGTDPRAIDKAMVHFGMPMGPFALLDQIGFDTASKASKAIETLNERYLPRASVMSRLIEAGRLGVKNGKGFYRYRKGKNIGFDKHVLGLVEHGDKSEHGVEDIQARLYLPMVNEAVRCLAAGVARSPADVDLGMVLGTGFPPFRGGPLRNADIMGIPAVVERLNELATRVGERLSPEPRLVQMGLSGERFYPPVSQ